MGDYIKLSKYSGGFVYRHFWTVEIKFNADGKSGKITTTTGGDAEFQSDFVEKIQNILDNSKFTELPSGGDVDADMGYGVPLLHIKFQGKSFTHTPPSGCNHIPVAHPSTAQLTSFCDLCIQLLGAAHQLVPSVPTSPSADGDAVM